MTTPLWDPIGAMTAATSETLERERLQRPPQSERVVPAVTLACALVLAIAWRIRDELLLRAEAGVGYGLGIVGLSLMVLLLLYPASKRIRGLRSWLPVRRWFRIHMVMGIVGPAAILLHSNFQLGSLNSTVALACMILVAASGYVGRYIYAGIHRSIYGQRLYFEELRREADAGWGAVEAVVRQRPDVAPTLDRFEAWVVTRPKGSREAAWRLLLLGSRTRRARRTCIRNLRSSVENSWVLEAVLDEYLEAACRLARFNSYERLFSLWHAVHLPLSLLLFGAAATHVLAVHMF